MIHPTSLTSNGYFHDNYRDARKTWLKKVGDTSPILRQMSWQHSDASSIPHSLSGPEGECLVTDLLWLGKQDARKVGLIFSATHGIEGYVGSAVQGFLLDFLATYTDHPGDEIALLFVHALNPWGMAWKRRCDEGGVDLNRNYIDFSKPPVNSGYRLLQGCLDIADRIERQQGLNQLAATFDKTEYEIALSGGQYSDATGPFYGGSAPAHGHLVCRELVQRYDLSQRQLVVVDIHSGLGAWSYGELISDHPLDNRNDGLAQKIFGPGVTNPARGDSSSVAKYGLQDYFWHGVMGQEGCYLTLEFGSYSTQALFDVIIDDHLVWRENSWRENGDSKNPVIARQQEAMLLHFCPSDPHWRQLVLIQAAQVLERLIKGLQHC